MIAPLLLVLACTQGPALRSQITTAPAPPTAKIDSDRVRFIAVGDAGQGNDVQQRVAQAMVQLCQDKADEHGPGCDFVAYLGDNFYPKGVSGPDDPQWQRKWSDIYADLQLPFYVALGNHDYGNPPFDRRRARAELQGPPASPDSTSLQWVMPGPWYAFDAGPARFVVLDSQALMMGWTNKQQGAFVRQQVDSAGDRPVVVLAHHPFKSNGQHGNAGTYEGTSYIPYSSGGRIQDFYTDLLCGHATLLLSAHDHNRQWLSPRCGIELVVAGSGSRNKALVGRGNATLFEEDKKPGFAWIEITVDRLHGELVDEHGQLDFSRDVAIGPTTNQPAPPPPQRLP